MSKELATVEPAGLPELYKPVHADDLQMSGVYLIAELSAMAREGVAKPGDVVLALGAEDIDPTFLIGGPEERETFTGYVIARDPFVASTADSTMTFLPKDYVRKPDERDVWNGYFFYVTLPEFDTALPARMMLWRTAGTPVARKINTFMARQHATGNYDPTHVEFGIQNAIGVKSRQPYKRLTVKSIPADEDLAIAVAQQQMYAASQARFNTPDVPADENAPTY